MKVLFEGFEYWIEFRRGEKCVDKIYPSMFGTNALSPRETTTCVVRNASTQLGDTSITPEHPIVAQATVTRYYKDQPSKEAARKAALTKALKLLVNRQSYPDGGKAVRRLFWLAYLNRRSVIGHGVIR